MEKKERKRITNWKQRPIEVDETKDELYYQFKKRVELDNFKERRKKKKEEKGFDEIPLNTWATS